VTTPAEQGEELDYIVLGYTPSPGTCVPTGHDNWKSWDIQAAKGTTGASSNLNGDPIKQFSITFHLTEFTGDGVPTGDFENWTAFRKLIESLTSGPTPIALPIYHPDLAESGITEVSSGGIGAAVHDGTGGKSYTVKFIEYKPPKAKPSGKAKAKPAGGTVPGKPPPPPDPNAKAKAELAQLLAVARQP
jgi:hypothetical protein